MNTISFGTTPYINKKQNFITKQTNNHPVMFPVAMTIGTAAIGAGLGRILPVTEDTFIEHSIYQRGDELLKNVHDADSCYELIKDGSQKNLQTALDFVRQHDKDFADSTKEGLGNKLEQIGRDFMDEIRVVMGKEAFDVVASEIHNEKMLESGRKMLPIEANERQGAFKQSLKNEFEEFKKSGSKEVPEKYKSLFKSIKKSNMKVLAFILGLTSAVTFGIYSRTQYNKKQNAVERFLLTTKNNK